MTLRIIDGFDYLPSGTGNNDDSIFEAMGWSGDINRMVRRTNSAFEYGYSLGIGGNVNNIDVYKDLRGRYTEDLDYVIWGVRMYVPPDTPIMEFRFYDTWSNSLVQFEIHFTVTGNIKFINATTGTILTPAWTFYPGRWFYFECKVKPGLGTDGMVEFRVNTVVVLSLPNCCTAAGATVDNKAAIDVLRIHSGGTNSGQHVLDDMYLLDSLGTMNNDYLGNVRVKLQQPIANATPLDWTIGGSAPAATNWQSVLDATLSETTFVYSSTPADRDLYEVNAPISSPYIFGVELDGIYRQDDATQRVVRNTLQTSIGTDDYGDDHYCYGFYVTAYDIFELSPDSGLAWTQSEVNQLLIGPEVVS